MLKFNIQFQIDITTKMSQQVVYTQLIDFCQRCTWYVCLLAKKRGSAIDCNHLRSRLKTQIKIMKLIPECRHHRPTFEKLHPGRYRWFRKSVPIRRGLWPGKFHGEGLRRRGLGDRRSSSRRIQWDCFCVRADRVWKVSHDARVHRTHSGAHI